MAETSQKYQDRAEQLAKAIDIAEAIVKKSTLLDDRTSNHFINWGREMKNLALNPEPPFNRIVSLKYIESDFLTYWNEADGQDVDEFWIEVYKKNLGFERKDAIGSALKRKRIKDIHEYDNIIDNIVAAEQLGRIDKQQVLELNRLLGEFEMKRAGKEK